MWKVNTRLPNGVINIMVVCAQFLSLAADGVFVCPAMFISQVMAEAGVEVHRYNFTAGTYPVSCPLVAAAQ